MVQRTSVVLPASRGSMGSLSPFRAMQDEMERMLQAFATPQIWSSGGAGAEGALGLRVDIGETEDEIQVKADLPGISEEDVEVTLEDDILRLHAEKKQESEQGDRNWRVVERSFGSYERAIRVPQGIDPSDVKADFDKGVLTVTLPRPKEAKKEAKRIKVGQSVGHSQGAQASGRDDSQPGGPSEAAAQPNQQSG